jgi:tripartite-type tricarboxylate transporter receptor subunit TctC
MQVSRRLSFVVATVLVAAAVAPSHAQVYPAKSVRVVVPFPPGGPVDVVARIVAPRMSEAVGQQIVVENRSGASGTIGTGSVAKSAPDGYTLIVGTTTTLTVAPRLYQNLSYDPGRDLQPLSRLAVVPSVLVVHPSIPATSVRELVAFAKAHPGKLTYGSAGPGTAQHLAVELFKQMSRTDILHVPYKGGAPAMADLLGGQIALTIEPLNTALPQLQSGRLRGLAVSTPGRSPALPNLPTISESLPGYEATLWIGLLGPAGMPPDVTKLLHAAAVKSLSAPEVRERMAQQGATPIGDSIAEFAEVIRRDTVRWAELVKKLDLKLE